MNMSKHQIIKYWQTANNNIGEWLKVLSSMLFVFLVLTLMGPLTHAVQHIEHLF